MRRAGGLWGADLEYLLRCLISSEIDDPNTSIPSRLSCVFGGFGEY